MIRVPGERSRHPPQRRRARARNGVAPYSPASVCRGAKSAGDGAKKGGASGTDAASLPLTLTSDIRH
ncbi:TPA: hypothetical protein MIW65_27250 [Klebsiella pneumoniae]|nr:hypothetical protein [Klebsiella pneumoniae]